MMNNIQNQYTVDSLIDVSFDSTFQLYHTLSPEWWKCTGYHNAWLNKAEFITPRDLGFDIDSELSIHFS